MKNYSLPKSLFVESGIWIPAHTVIEHVHVIAGSSVPAKLRNAERLTQKYGGNADNWMKKVGKVKSSIYEFDVHWYEHDLVGAYEYKVKNYRRREGLR